MGAPHVKSAKICRVFQKRSRHMASSPEVLFKLRKRTRKEARPRRRRAPWPRRPEGPLISQTGSVGIRDPGAGRAYLVAQPQGQPLRGQGSRATSRPPPTPQHQLSLLVRSERASKPLPRPPHSATELHRHLGSFRPTAQFFLACTSPTWLHLRKDSCCGKQDRR